MCDGFKIGIMPKSTPNAVPRAGISGLMTDSLTGIARRSSGLIVTAALALAVPVTAQSGNQQNSFSRPSDRFVSVNGVLLHHLDWGGDGETILFLTGLGDSVHRFDSFALNFTDHFRVLGLTRRGQGLSGKPASGYDTETLVEDLRRFLDAMQIDRVTLIGHSIAGVEMTRFAAKYPRRVSKLVYLDAAHDWAQMHELAAEAHIPFIKYLNKYHEAIDTHQSHPDLTKVTAPALAFFVIFDAKHAAQDEAVLCPGCEKEVATSVKRFYQLMLQRDFWNEQSEVFRRNMRRGRVITLRDTNHFFFQDPKRVDEVVGQMRDFLSSAK
jgi:pimeloyl-ACP methyl ester carboxylesterase